MTGSQEVVGSNPIFSMGQLTFHVRNVLISARVLRICSASKSALH